MAQDVIVTALQSFEYRGRMFTAGRHLEMSPLDAVVKARQRLVSLTKVIDPVLTEPEPVRRRRYRRRDMVAQS